ncbi:Bcr/CflA family efflux MFS transporter [Palleronia sediminis]|uniref:Bcr/CflA family efflux transporter n=1 Tax=Palleronia sediminis TaxID=2547833 RepID=A0A4R6AFV6_9RHOB|nr:multidrug effflux MFS transporter [Palleronia sediminis]TDL81318.1 Bcr/CflA family efflux MFS transporter [Palleronia sediminis]
MTHAPTPAPVRFLDRSTPPSLATLILVTSLSALSMNLFLPSLPNMTAFFDTSYGIMQISVAGYLGVNAVLQLFLGPLSDRYGRRRVLLIAVAIFVLASVGCILATTIEVFLVFRLMQAAIVAGFVLPRAAIRDMYAQNRAASMIAWVTMGMSVAPMMAPALGGVLDDLFGWRANFTAFAVLGVAALVLIRADMGETAKPMVGGFRAQVAEYPGLLRSPRFWGYAATNAAASGAFFAYLGGAPYVGSTVYGLSPTMLGLYFGAPAVGYLVGNGVSGRFSEQMGVPRMVLWGTLVTLAGLSVAVAVKAAGIGGPAAFFGFMSFVGLGNGLVIPNATAGMLSVRPHLAGTASGLGGAIMIGGGAALSALAGFLLAGSDTAMPLLLLMTASSAAAVLAIVLTLRRERRVERQRRG